MIPLLLAFLIPLAAELLDLEMDSGERKKTGVCKLSDKEKASLHRWIDAHYKKRDVPLQQDPSDKHGQIEANLFNGRQIRLSDKTSWNIHPSDTPISQGWITPVDIIVSSSNDTEYPYILTNSLTGSSILAQKP